MRYTIKGDTLPVLILNLDSSEKVITEAGSMSWMSPNMRMETTSGGGLGKVFGRVLAGESMFQNIYEAVGNEGMIALASKFPGSIKVFDISPYNQMIIQKRSFLASEKGVDLSVFFQRNIGIGFFGGEGFIMQKLSGNGLAFIEIDGSAIEYDLAVGESMVVDTNHIVAMNSTCSIDIKSTGSVKNAIFGGEGLFNTVITGPGKLILQTMPLSKVIGMISIKKPNINL